MQSDCKTTQCSIFYYTYICVVWVPVNICCLKTQVNSGFVLKMQHPQLITCFRCVSMYPSFNLQINAIGLDLWCSIAQGQMYSHQVHLFSFYLKTNAENWILQGHIRTKRKKIKHLQKVHCLIYIHPFSVSLNYQHIPVYTLQIRVCVQHVYNDVHLYTVSFWFILS